jgi:hypothetical protein
MIAVCVATRSELRALCVWVESGLVLSGAAVGGGCACVERLWGEPVRGHSGQRQEMC